MIEQKGVVWEPKLQIVAIRDWSLEIRATFPLSLSSLFHSFIVTTSKKMPSPENLMDFLIKEGNGVKGLSQLNLNEVPHQFIQPSSERFENLKVAQDRIPVIDVSNWDDKPEIAQSICEAARRWGFFQIINHGIPTHILQGVIKCCHDFFDLPVEERRKYVEQNSPTDTVVLKTSFNATVDRYMDWKDHLVHTVDQQHDKESKLWPPVSRASNLLESALIEHDRIMSCRTCAQDLSINDRVLSYICWARPTIKKLLQVLMNGINVKKIDEEMERSLMGLLVTSLVYYPPCPSPHLAVGSGRHSDVSSITLLLQDDIGGLYARSDGDADTWIHVAPTKGALIVNIGDALQIMSNNRYKSTDHRVFLTGRNSRVSIPIFANGLSDSVIGPLSEVLDDGQKPMYKQVVFSDYFNHFLSKNGKRAINFAKI
ncbi:hypothetical protein OROGR_003093 [Orobanche gracilis]